LQPILVAPRQYRILEVAVETRGVNAGELASRLGVRQEDLMRDLVELEARGLITTSKSLIKYYVLSETGKQYLQMGLPEEIVYSHLLNFTGRSIDELTNYIASTKGIPRDEVLIGLQYLVRGRCILIEKKVVKAVNEDKCSEVLAEASVIKKALSNLAEGGKVDEGVLAVLKKRRLIEQREKALITITPSRLLIDLWSRGLVKEKVVITVVKPEYALDLDKYVVKEFDLTIEPPTPPLSKKHPFMQFIDELREVMVSMGFEEVKGPHVEAELWNFDALFQAQDHPAREIHDTFFVKTDLKATPPQDVMERARRVHEAGWGYKWSPERAMRLVLRSQTTAVSARSIYERGPGEYRVFTIDRNFRPENLDAKHSMEFYQLDGIIVGKDVNFKHLLYFFKELAAALGIREVWFKPGYFPFTEPSVEGYVKHSKLGWIEVFPGGMFRPEVMEILGATGYNAAAWGIGVDRLAMVVLGLDDIRLLFTRDIDILKSTRYPGLPYFTHRTSGRGVVVVSTPR